MSHQASESRYASMPYRRCGKSGLELPAISLGLWHNFGGVDVLRERAAPCCCGRSTSGSRTSIWPTTTARLRAPPRRRSGASCARTSRGHRDELVHLDEGGLGHVAGAVRRLGLAQVPGGSLDQSLKRMGVDYVDIFYHHRPDPKTPLEETMGALDFIVRSGRALYAGISSYEPDRTREAIRLLRGLGTPCLIHQPSYSMFNRWIEDGLLEVLAQEGVGCIVFSPLAQGLLTDRYLGGIPQDSRAAKPHGFLKPKDIDEAVLARVRRLGELARARGQSLAQMALAWVLRHPGMTSAVIGASRTSQIDDAVGALARLDFTGEELKKIDAIVQR